MQIHYLNSAGHKNEDQNPSAFYDTNNGFYSCSGCEIKGFAIDRDDPNFNKSGTDFSSVRSSARAARYRDIVEDFDPAKSLEYSISCMFRDVHRNDVLYYQNQWWRCDSCSGLWSDGNDYAYREMLAAAECFAKYSKVSDKRRRSLNKEILHNHVITAALKMSKPYTPVYL